MKVKKFVIVCIIGCFILLGVYFTQTVTVSTDAVTERPIATVKLSTGESFKIQLYPDEAPNTVNNFLYLAGIGFYDQTRINRIVPGYLIQAGDPIGDGKGFPGYFIKSECGYNGTKNSLRHKKGTVSMARSNKFNTEGSQFFIMLTDDSHLNGQYSSFGTIIEGIEVVEALSMNSVDQHDRPVENLKIEEIQIDTFGRAYEKPQILSVKEVLAQYE